MSQSADSQIARVVASRPEVAAAWIFGSFARGDARPDSDVDVAILLADASATAATHHRALGALALDLEHALGGRRIDLAVLDDRTSPIFAHRVLAEGRLLHEADRERRIAFEWRASVRYLDFRPTWELAARSAAEGFQRWLERDR
ncbi:MAG: nucleotidyltransferase domain-containing protein [Myxococcota bacterium]|nr:nucleotidyltransferase domain-containing protein [Myxococcota bacterium]